MNADVRGGVIAFDHIAALERLHDDMHVRDCTGSSSRRAPWSHLKQPEAHNIWHTADPIGGTRVPWTSDSRVHGAAAER
jgi:hypothetical protein